MSCNPQPGLTAGICLLCAFFISCVMACVTSPIAALCALAIGLGFFLWLGRQDKSSVAPFLATNFFLLLLWLLVPWTAPGETVFKLGFLNITREGIWLCAMSTIKANAIILVFLGIMRGMTPMKLGLALAQLRFSPKLALILVLAGQQIENLRSEWKILRDAARLRGFRARTSLHSWKTIASMLAFLLLRASERAEHLHEALLLRAFKGKFPICCALRPHKLDFVLISLSSISIIALIILNWIPFAWP